MSVKDLSSLFRWKREVEIKDNNGKTVTTVYIRIVGDLDYQTAHRHALVASREIRKKLKDENSLDSRSLFLDIEEKDKTELVFGTLMAEIGNFRDLAMEELGEDLITLPELSDNPTLEEKEEQLEAEETTESEKIKKLRDKMDEKSEGRRKELEAKTIKELRDIYKTSTVNIRCLEVFSSTFRDYCVFAGTYLNKEYTKKAFKVLEEYQDLASSVKRQLLESYLDLELTGEQLKN